MLCVIAFFSGDKHLAVDLASWLEQLGGVSTHDCLLVVDKSTNSVGVVEPLRRAFKSVTETSSEPAGHQGLWGTGTTDATAANEMWLTAGDYVYHMMKRPWGWLEVDAVPMRPTWLDEWENEYLRAKKPFMGAYVNISPHEPHMSGIGVYPADVARFSLDMKIPNKIAWDYAGRRDTVGKQRAHFTTLIQHEYRVNREAPTFPTRESLSIIRPATAVFHRCKDMSLTARLREIHAENRGAIAISENMASKAPNPLEAENAELRQRLERLETLLQKGGDAQSNHVCATQITSAESVAKSNAAPKVQPPRAAKRRRGKRMTKRKDKRTPERIAADKARMVKARAGRKVNA